MQCISSQTSNFLIRRASLKFYRNKIGVGWKEKPKEIIIDHNVSLENTYFEI